MALAQRIGSACAGQAPAPGAAIIGVAPASSALIKRRCWHSRAAAPQHASAAGGHHWDVASAAVHQRRLAPACAAAASAPPASTSGRRPDPVYMEEYKQLKERILTTARKAGAGLAAYLLLTVDGEAGLCALLGMAANNLYLSLLFRDVDAFTGETRVPMREAEQIEQPLARNVAKVGAAYRHALQPRLLVLVAVAALAAAWNQLNPDQALDAAHQGSLLGGFLMYKVPLVLLVADDNLPKSYGDNEMSRPTIEKFDDELDRWGRPRKPIVTMPTEVLPDNIDAEQAQTQMEALSSGVAKLTTTSAAGSNSNGNGSAAQPGTTQAQAQAQQQQQ